MSTDPAVDAVERAHGYDWPASCDAEVGAREALAPIRELHTPWQCNCCPGLSCAECRSGWPCATSRMCYSDEELGEC